MKTLNLAVVCVILLLFACGLASAQPAGKSSDAETAWRQLEQTEVLSGLQHTNEQAAAAAVLAVSEKAKAFYTQFPVSSNALAAKILECKMLEVAYYHGGERQVFVAWINVQGNLVPNSKLSADERFDLRLMTKRVPLPLKSSPIRFQIP